MQHFCENSSKKTKIFRILGYAKKVFGGIIPLEI